MRSHVQEACLMDVVWVKLAFYKLVFKAGVDRKVNLLRNGVHILGTSRRQSGKREICMWTPKQLTQKEEEESDKGLQQSQTAEGHEMCMKREVK